MICFHILFEYHHLMENSSLFGLRLSKMHGKSRAAAGFETSNF